jgi:hypothetical protein
MTRATWNLTAATWALVGAAIGGMIFTLYQLGIERRWRRGEHLFRFRDLFEGATFCNLRRDLAVGRLAQLRAGESLTYDNAPPSSWRVLDFLESLCREVDEKRLSLEDVWSEYAEWITLYSADFRAVIVEQRRVRGDHTYYSSIDSVVRQLDVLCEKKGLPKVTFSAKDILDFYQVDAGN